MNTTATPQQITALHAALHAKNLLGKKAEIVEAVTHGRTSSSKLLTTDEAHALIADLNKNYVKADEGKKMRGSIIAMAHDMGMIPTINIVVNDSIIPKKDYSHLDAWMHRYSYLKKKLFDYTYAELPTLVTQFKKVYEAHLKK
jgi:hypothetical protein